ncbi:hypothetical protein PPNSA23_12000 [Phyllobacterium phragmitis]|uniref:Uncharacterized protein n=1 Tax=Phyllobacterium phragmitis TaxID=2670329 RepID=A0ABQ0GX59_9HYPH
MLAARSSAFLPDTSSEIMSANATRPLSPSERGEDKGEGLVKTGTILGRSASLTPQTGQRTAA